MQVFTAHPYYILDLKDWYDKGELDLTPNFQRRDVWIDKARSFLIDTILRGKPIPQIYIRLKENPKSRRKVREVVDGQQRLTTVFNFLEDGFSINKVHNDEFGGMYFSQLDKKTQDNILYYRFTVVSLEDAPDAEIYDIFARLNKYPVKINAQELRNSQWFGAFKTTTYQLAREFTTFWLKNQIFTDKQIARMVEAEFTAELLIAMMWGIKDKTKPSIDKAFRDNDNSFSNRVVFVKRFRETMDLISAIMQGTLLGSSFNRDPLFYSLFCAIYHMQWGIPKLDTPRTAIKSSDQAKIRAALASVEAIFAVEKADLSTLTEEQRKFKLATETHTIHALNREIRTTFLAKLIYSSI